MSKQVQFYAPGSPTPSTAVFTEKTCKVLTPLGEKKHRIYKPDHDSNMNNAKLHTLTFPNGTKRQYFFTRVGYGRVLPSAEEQLKKDLAIKGDPGDIHCVVHPDDKQYDRFVLAWGVREIKKTRSIATGIVEEEEDLPVGVREETRERRRSRSTKYYLNWWEVPTKPRDWVYGNYIYTTEYEVKTIWVRQRWVQWGSYHILLHDGITSKDRYYYDTPIVTQKADGLFLKDFPSSGPHNPFDDPYEPHLKAFRQQRFAFKEEIAKAVFDPVRVFQMVTKYGDDWIESI